MENRPDHYDEGIEAVDVIESHGLNFNLGNVIKYVLRAGKKESQSKVSDLSKAIWYAGREMTNYKADRFELYPSARVIAVDGKMLPEINLPPAPQFTGTSGEQLIEYAGRVCYDSFGKENSRPTAAYLDHIVESRHTSVLGHAVLYFTATEYELKKFVWLFRSEPGWYLDHANVLTINLRLFERRKPYFYEYYPEVWNAFHEAFPLVVTYRCQKVMVPRLFPYNERGRHRWISFHLSCSRSCSHEWVRHSYQSAISQRSTRYVDEGDFSIVHHPLMRYFPALFHKFNRDATFLSYQSKQLYNGIVKKAEKEMIKAGFEKHVARKAARGAAARFLPHGLKTEIVYSASIYEWEEIFKQRISAHADGEIKELATMCEEQIGYVLDR